MENKNDVKGGLVVEQLKRYTKRLYDFTGHPANVSLEIWHGIHRDNPGYSVGFTVYDSGADKFLVQNLTWMGDDIREIGKLIDCHIEAEARKALKEGLAQCTETQQNLFKQMYTGGLAMNQGIDVNMVVDEMESEKLDLAMQQVQDSINKQGELKK